MLTAMPCRARAGFCAPIFWAEKADTADIIAPGMMNISPQSFSATPTPADAISPKPLRMARITIKDTPVSASCAAMGNP